MTVQKTPVALIQVLDAAGKVTNLEVEFSCVYVGTDPDIARSFVPGRVREEVDAETFAKYTDESLAEASAELGRLGQQIADLQQQIADKDEAAKAQTAEYDHALSAASARINELTAALNTFIDRVAKAREILA